MDRRNDLPADVRYAAVADNHGVSWESLSEGQREVLGQFADTWDRFPEERQARLARGAERWAV